jgi:Transposase DDE domain group 1
MDITTRLIGSENIWERGAALTSRLHAFETERLAEAENLAGLTAINRELIGRAEAIESPRRVVLDMDSTEIPVYGQQEHRADHGHFESIGSHPLLLCNREGDCLAAKLRPGNVHSAEDWDELLLPEIERQRKRGEAVVLGRCGLRQAGDLRGIGGAWRDVCDPSSREQQPGAGDRGVVD